MLDNNNDTINSSENIQDKSDIVKNFHNKGKVRRKNKVADKPWTMELDDELTVMYCEGVHVKEMAKHFGRTAEE